jgi:hypothetical protein
MLRRCVSLTRAGLAGLVWAVIYGVPFALIRLLDGDTSPHHPTSAVQSVASLGLMVVFLSAFGLVLALPYTALLDAWEVRFRPSARHFLIGSLLQSGCWAAVLVLWYEAVHPQAYYPDSGFSGTARVGTTAFVAALAAGYAVGRWLPQTGDNPAERAYRRYRGLLWGGICLGVCALLTFLFPAMGGSSLAMMR